MSKHRRPPTSPLIVNPGEEIPPGTRQVTQTTVAKFTEPIVSQPSEVEPEDDPELELLEEDVVDEEEEILLSPLDRFLASLSEADDAVIYVRRKTDPPGLQRPFKNQWTSPIVTIGEIPYDESFTDKTAIDLAVQKIFGGGYFQLQIRRSGGQILKTWSTLIADVVASADARHEDPAPKSQPADDGSLSEIERSINVVERIWTLMNSRRPANRSGETPPTVTTPSLPPLDPADELTRTVDMFDKMTASMERLRGPVGNGSDSIGIVALNLLGGVLRDPSVAPVLGGLAQFLIAKAQGLGGPPKEVLDYLDTLVNQLTQNNAPVHSARYTVEFLNKNPQYQSFVAQFANQSATEILITISQLKPEFSHVRKLPHGPAWIDNFKHCLAQSTLPTNGKAEAPAPSASPETAGSPQPAAPDQSAIRNSQSEIQTPQPVSPAELAYGRLLRRCAADMCYSTDHRDGDGELDDVCSADVAVAETIKLIQNFPEYGMQIQLVLAASPQQLVEFVATECQDATLLENPGSVLFAADYQSTLRETWSAFYKSPAVPPAPESQQTTSGTESVPPAVAGGPTRVEASAQ